mgnify:CR=1 FL=1
MRLTTALQTLILALRPGVGQHALSILLGTSVEVGSDAAAAHLRVVIVVPPWSPGVRHSLLCAGASGGLSTTPTRSPHRPQPRHCSTSAQCPVRLLLETWD